MIGLAAFGLGARTALQSATALLATTALVAATVLVAPMTLLAAESTASSPYVVVLGIAQDGGAPQAGSREDPGWRDPAARHRVVCLGVVDPSTSQRWMIEATPDFPAQLHALDTLAATPVVGGRAPAPPGLDGIFLTHAHVGHYAGLLHLGHEVMGATGVPVFAMPRMLEFLRTNGPWEMLVRRDNIVLHPLQDGTPVQLNTRLRLVPLRVPHRQEYSEVVGFRIEGPQRSVLFIPDIDSWEQLDAMGVRIETLIRQVDAAYLDATFYADGEIPGRDMRGFLHPFITHSMARFDSLPAAERTKVRFIHLNHTNPALDPRGPARQTIELRGYHVATEMERLEL